MAIRNKVMSALRWSAASRLIGQVASWAITIFVIRLLSPGDYGLMAMAMVLVSFLVILNTLGFDAVLVQQKRLDTQIRRQVFGVVIIVNTTFFLLLWYGASAVANFYGEADLEPVLKILSVQFLLLIFETLPQSELERNIQFAGRSVVDLASLLSGSLTTLALALAGCGVWALVWGTLASTATRMVGLNLICPCLVIPSFSVRGLGANLSFGLFVTTDRGLWYVFSESDKFIGGKLLGNQMLGYYAVASHLASLPINKITGLLNSVAFPAFSRTHQGEGEEAVRRYLLKSTQLMAVLAFPIFFGMSATAEALIGVLFGEKWLPAAPLLQLLGLVMPFRLLSNVFSPLLWGVGAPRASAINYAMAALLMPIAFFVGARWGIIGIAYGWLLMYPIVFLVTAWRTCRQVSLSLAAYFGALLRPLAAGIALYGAVLWLQGSLPSVPGDWLYFVQLVAGGGVVWCFTIAALDRASIREIVSLARGGAGD